MRSLAAQGTDAVRTWLVGHRESDLPAPQPTPLAITKWLIDEGSIQQELLLNRLRLPNTDFRRRLRSELSELLTMARTEGWLDDPASFHRTPPPLADPEVRRRRLGRLSFEHVRFESGYAPRAGAPGRERWLGYDRNRRAHAWVLRHDGPPRPWILCVNGYRTGWPATDLPIFRAGDLHHKLGLNVAIAVLPLHGPRAQGRSGDRVMFSGAVNTVHTATQGAWDIRRLLSWIRGDQEAPAVGISGISLGGFMVGLVASLDDDLACVIAGIPEADLVRGMRRHVEVLLPPFYEQWGLSWEPMEEANRLVSPLAMKPLVPRDRRFIYAGLLDRWVRPGNVKELWEHWDRPSIHWYQGSHLSAVIEPSVRRYVDEALRSSLLA